MTLAIRSIALAAALVPVLFAGSALAAEPTAALSGKAPDAKALIAAAGDSGSVPVIITLAPPAQARMFGAAGNDDAAIAAGVRAVVDPFIAEVLRPVAGAQSRSATAAPPIKTMPYLPMVATSVSRADLERIAASPAVVQIVRDGLNKPSLTQSVPLIGGIEAAAAGATGAGRTIGILDSGVQFNHPFLAGRIAGSSCHSSNTGGGRTLCPNGQTSQYDGNAGTNCTVSDRCSHGTHVAGIAAGSKPGSTPPRGVAPGARIYSVQVFSNFSGSIGAWDSDVLAGLQDLYARRNSLNIAAANISLGSTAFTGYCNSGPVAAAIQQLRNAGVATIIATGNDGYTNRVSWPSCIEAAISVGASTKSNQISWFSNMAPMVDLMAPGSAITSSVVGSRYESYDGTSMAAPHVAGAFAALKSAVPNATVSQIEGALKATGVAIVDNRRGGATTRPRIDINLALRKLKSDLAPPPANDTFSRAVSVPWTRGGARTVTGSNVRATLQSGERRGSSVVQATVWWKLTAVATERILVKTAGSSFNTTLGIYTGSAVNALTQVAFNDNATGGSTSSVVLYAVAGRTYYIQVGGYGSARGRISLSFGPPPPTNDNFSGATTLVPRPAGITLNGSNALATLETGERTFISAVTRTVWWKFTPTSTGIRAINTDGSSFDTTLAVYRGPRLQALSTLAANDDFRDTKSRVSTNFVAGTTYYIQVGGRNGASGAIRLTMEPSASP